MRSNNFGGDGISGYFYSIENAGKYHIPYKTLTGSYGIFEKQAWNDYSTYSLWLDRIKQLSFLFPHRF